MKAYSLITFKCMDCYCIGTLNQKKGKVFLVADEVLSTRSIHTQQQDLQRKPTWKKKITAKMSLAKHGSATDKQQYAYLILGSVFWITVMLIGRPLFDLIMAKFMASEFPFS